MKVQFLRCITILDFQNNSNKIYFAVSYLQIHFFTLFDNGSLFSLPVSGNACLTI